MERSEIRWAPRARQDLLDIWEYLFRMASPEVADNLLRDVQRALNRVAEVDPAMYRVRSDLTADLPEYGLFPYNRMVFFTGTQKIK